MSTYERKYSECGNYVIILYSPGFGAGWSTWATQHAEQMLFDKRFVEAAIAGVKDIEPLAKEIFGEDYPYLGGWEQIRILWMPIGSKFIVEEYDGSESVKELPKLTYYTA